MPTKDIAAVASKLTGLSKKELYNRVIELT